jgi:hypothetical protein
MRGTVAAVVAPLALLLAACSGPEPSPVESMSAALCEVVTPDADGTASDAEREERYDDLMNEAVAEGLPIGELTNQLRVDCGRDFINFTQ